MFLTYLLYLLSLKLIFCFSSGQKISQYNDNTNIFKSRKLRFLNENKDDDRNATFFLTNRVRNLVRKELRAFLNRTENVSQQCIDLLYTCYIHDNKTNIEIEEEDEDIDNINNDPISNFFITKLFDGATKHKNDLSTYDICLYNNFSLPVKKSDLNDSYLIYFIMTLDESNRSKNETNANINNGPIDYYYSKALESEDILYIRAFCFPQNITQNGTACSDDDYYHFIKNLNSDLSDLLKLKSASNITYFSLKDEKLSGAESFGKALPLIIISLQIVFILLRYPIKYLFKCCRGKKEEEKIKPLNDTNEEFNLKNKEDISDDIDSNNKNSFNKKKSIYPKWFRVFNKCFSLTDNFRELFNFSLNSTDINNDSGLSYIRGLKSFSFFFLVFGLTLLSFINSFSKIYSKFLMHDFLSFLLYPLFFIGLRYSPRIIFSCSGYTLSFKFISYIQKNDSFFGLVKFILYQIHKYFMLFLFFIFQKFSLFILIRQGTESRPMWKYFEKNILNRPEGGKFLISFLDLTSIYKNGGDKRIDQTLIDYFWIPFNEAFFFFIGVIFLFLGYRLGYKYRFRIDYFFLGLILINLIGKILYSYLRKTLEGEDYYATLYYYLFDYGTFMIRPFFNSTYYLIGMYFGFINYSVQKGITSFNKTDSSQDKVMVDLQNMLSGEIDSKDEEKKEENNETEKEEIRDELIKMPFLKSGVSIIMWIKSNKIKTRIIGIITTVLLFFFVFSHHIYYYSTITSEYKSLKNELREIRINQEDNEELSEMLNNTYIDERYQKMEDLLLMGNYIKNGFVNFMYRIDIELVILLIQTLLFILYFRGKNFVNDFFCHIFWTVFNKPYYSIILTANPLILYIFYQNETKIILNFFNVTLYSIIGGTLSFIFGLILYLFFELPYKRLIHYLLSKEDQEEKYEEEDDENDDNKEKED